VRIVRIHINHKCDIIQPCRTSINKLLKLIHWNNRKICAKIVRRASSPRICCLFRRRCATLKLDTTSYHFYSTSFASSAGGKLYSTRRQTRDTQTFPPIAPLSTSKPMRAHLHAGWPAGGNRAKLWCTRRRLSFLCGKRSMQRQEMMECKSQIARARFIICAPRAMPPTPPADGVEYKWVGNRVNLGSFVVALPTSIWIMLSDLAHSLSRTCLAARRTNPCSAESLCPYTHTSATYYASVLCSSKTRGLMHDGLVIKTTRM